MLFSLLQINLSCFLTPISFFLNFQKIMQCVTVYDWRNICEEEYVVLSTSVWVFFLLGTGKFSK